MKCITCDNERDIYRGGGYLRTRCRICWNKYCKDNKYKHKAYFAAYLKEYIPEWRKKNKSYLVVNNKCNKKAIKELGYIPGYNLEEGLKKYKNYSIIKYIFI